MKIKKIDLNFEKIEKIFDGYNKIKKYKFQHKLFDSSWSKILSREILITKNAVAILPYDKVKNRVILVKQFRLGALLSDYNPLQIEVITGLVEKTDKDLKSAIIREAKEEAGINIKYKNIQPIRNVLNSSGSTNESTSIFFCECNFNNLEKIKGNINEDENIKVLQLSPRKVFKILLNKKIHSVNTIIALEWFKNYLNNTK
tara:strand:+ start:517 stop:1119 length:603 start_codon:yes stop_codon:yes gene_type:complete